jgi:hypothetical protein
MGGDVLNGESVVVVLLDVVVVLVAVVGVVSVVVVGVVASDSLSASVVVVLVAMVGSSLTAAPLDSSFQDVAVIAIVLTPAEKSCSASELRAISAYGVARALRFRSEREKTAGEKLYELVQKTAGSST